jgi:hypothetical protein
MDAIYTESEMAGLQLKHVRPDSKPILARMLAAEEAGQCLCGGVHCNDPADPGCRGLSKRCKYRWNRYMLEFVPPNKRDAWERAEIKRGHIMWPQQGQGKRKPRQQKLSKAAEAGVVAALKKRAKREKAAKSAKLLANKPAKQLTADKVGV